MSESLKSLKVEKSGDEMHCVLQMNIGQLLVTGGQHHLGQCAEVVPAGGISTRR